MKVLFDTNVIIDALTERYNEYSYSQNLLLKVVDQKIEGYICSNQVTDIYYILRKYFDENKRRRIIKNILETFNVLPLLPSFLSYSVYSEISDFEDSVIDEIAKVNMIDYIVSNNTSDFINSKSIIINPKDLSVLTNLEA